MRFISYFIKSKTKRILKRFGVDISQYDSNRQWLGLNNVEFNTIIDVGSNRGQFLEEILLIQSPKIIHCFEPNETLLPDLEKIKQSLPDCDFNIHTAAAGEENSEATIQIHESNDASSSLLTATSHFHDSYPKTTTVGSKKVRVIRIDDVVDITENDGPILVKFDCQGFDHHAMRGAQSLLSIAHTCIVEYSVADLYEGQSKFIDIAQIASENNLRFVGCLEQHHGKNGSISFLDAVFQKQT